VLCFCFVFLRLVYHVLQVSLNCPFLIALRYSLNVYLWYVALIVMLSILAK
jgi:hypothetical protein